MYGRRASLLSLNLRDWPQYVHANVRHWKNTPLLLQQSVERSFSDYHRIANNLREELGVAKKDFTNSTFKGFINVSLSQDQKNDFQAWDVEDSDVWLGLATYGERGYRFSLTYNAGNSNWVATYTAQDGTGKNEGYCVSGFASSPYDAARVLLFKVSCVLPDVWKEYKPLPSDTIG
jgi:hypothetical protein